MKINISILGLICSSLAISITLPNSIFVNCNVYSMEDQQANELKDKIDAINTEIDKYLDMAGKFAGKNVFIFAKELADIFNTDLAELQKQDLTFFSRQAHNEENQLSKDQRQALLRFSSKENLTIGKREIKSAVFIDILDNGQKNNRCSHLEKAFKEFLYSYKKSNMHISTRKEYLGELLEQWKNIPNNIPLTYEQQNIAFLIVYKTITKIEAQCPGCIFAMCYLFDSIKTLFSLFINDGGKFNNAMFKKALFDPFAEALEEIKEAGYGSVVLAHLISIGKLNQKIQAFIKAQRQILEEQRIQTENLNNMFDVDSTNTPDNDVITNSESMGESSESALASQAQIDQARQIIQQEVYDEQDSRFSMQEFAIFISSLNTEKKDDIIRNIIRGADDIRKQYQKEMQGSMKKPVIPAQTIKDLINAQISPNYLFVPENKHHCLELFENAISLMRSGRNNFKQRARDCAVQVVIELKNQIEQAQVQEKVQVATEHKVPQLKTSLTATQLETIIGFMDGISSLNMPKSKLQSKLEFSKSRQAGYGTPVKEVLGELIAYKNYLKSSHITSGQSVLKSIENYLESEQIDITEIGDLFRSEDTPSSASQAVQIKQDSITQEQLGEIVKLLGKNMFVRMPKSTLQRMFDNDFKKPGSRKSLKDIVDILLSVKGHLKKNSELNMGQTIIESIENYLVNENIDIGALEELKK